MEGDLEDGTRWRCPETGIWVTALCNGDGDWVGILIGPDGRSWWASSKAFPAEDQTPDIGRLNAFMEACRKFDQVKPLFAKPPPAATPQPKPHLQRAQTVHTQLTLF